MRLRPGPLFLACVLVLLCPGCLLQRGRINERLDPAAFEGLVPGESTAADVVAALGAPTEVVQLGFRSAYRYEHVKTKEAALFLLVLLLRGTDAQQDRAWVFFDENDVLTHFAATLESRDAEWALPVFQTDPDVVAERKRKAAAATAAEGQAGVETGASPSGE